MSTIVSAATIILLSLIFLSTVIGLFLIGCDGKRITGGPLAFQPRQPKNPPREPLPPPPQK